MERYENALTYYKNGFNCSQSVVASFTDILDLDEEVALRMVSGLKCMQHTCGAVTGAYMTIGFLRRKYEGNDEQANEITNKFIQKFSKRFAKVHGSINCKTRINYDLTTEEGLEAAKEVDVLTQKCTKCVKLAVTIMDDIFEEEINVTRAGDK